MSSPPQTNSLQLIMHPTPDTEGQEGHEQEQEQDRMADTTAAMGLGAAHRMIYHEDPQRESASTADEAEQEIMDPYETAFMELRILRLSSRRLLNAVLRLSRSELGRMTRDANLDDQMAVRIFDVHINLEATTNAMSRLYGYKSNRFRRAEPLGMGRTENHGLHSVDDRGASSETNSSQGEPWDSDSPTLRANTSVDTLAVSAPPEVIIKDVDREITPKCDSGLRHTLRRQWRGFLDNLRNASFQDILSMVILFVFVELAMEATRGVYRIWAKDVKYQCWEAV
ncbi:hypothetical protein GSI_08510 [Ganoderma sinense ZZ0214-1]|uniref:Transporter n=1 Tax=Ganoderma sinense ZZ0214-1 TaxID=1077348 RepID=A0A2G8S3X8_9APHY|nr:hypothetical protein GSI_08510 [Ganoderma sinense ZZ0214-1]